MSVGSDKTDIGTVVEETAAERTRWRRVYLVVLLITLLVYVVLYLFSRAYSGD